MILIRESIANIRYVHFNYFDQNIFLNVYAIN